MEFCEVLMFVLHFKFYGGVELSLGQRSSACIVLKLASQREEGEKREGVQIAK